MWFLLSAYFSKQIVHQIKDEEQINCQKETNHTKAYTYATMKVR